MEYKCKICEEVYHDKEAWERHMEKHRRAEHHSSIYDDAIDYNRGMLE